MKKEMEVFEFKEEEEEVELQSNRFSSQKNPSHDRHHLSIDKYMFLQNFTQDKVQSEEINHVECVDVDADAEDANCNDAVTSKLTDADCFVRIVPGLNGASQIGLTNEEQGCEIKNTSGSSFCDLDLSSRLLTAPPLNNELKFTNPEYTANDEASSEGVSDDGETLSDRLGSASSLMGEDSVRSDEPSIDHALPGFVMGDGEVDVVFCPDYIRYRNVTYTDCVLTFSSSCIEVKGPTDYGNQGTFIIHLGFDEIIDIISVWSQKTARVKIHLTPKAVIQSKTAGCASEIEELDFAVHDYYWIEKQERISSLDNRYRSIWNMFCSDMDNFGSTLIGGKPLLLPQSCIDHFDCSFEEVIYPKGEADAVSISKRDIDLLQPDTFVNDTIIDFYIKYMKNKIEPEERHRFHFFNSFFFRKLADMDKDPSSAFDGMAAFQRVRKWTRKVNLFEKDFLFIPVNYGYHWSLIVICHPGDVANLKDEDAKKRIRVPCILHMDSIRGSHAGLKDLIQSYLLEEWKERHKETSEDMSSEFLNMRFLTPELPQQQNSYDCGLFLLHYVEKFLDENPANFNPNVITKSDGFLQYSWFVPDEASDKRRVIRNLIYDLVKDKVPDKASFDGSDKCSPSFNVKTGDDENDNTIEILSEACKPLKDCQENLLCAQAVQGIEMTLLPASSLNSQCPTDSGLVLREFFEPGAASGSLIDAHFQGYERTVSFDEFKSSMPQIQEEMEAGIHYDYLTAEARLQHLDKTVTESSAFPYPWNSGIPVHQTANGDMDLSMSVCESDDSSGAKVDGGCHLVGGVSLDGKLDQQPKSTSTGNVECVTDCIPTAPGEMVDVAEYQFSADPLTSNQKDMPGLRREDSVQDDRNVMSDDLQFINDDTESEPELLHTAKRMRITPSCDGGVDVTRSLSKDLHL